MLKYKKKEVRAMADGFSVLSEQYFSVSDIFVTKQFSREKTTIDMCATPRATDALLLFTSGTAICYQEGYAPCFVSQGALMYMPKGSRYTWDMLPSATTGVQERILFEFNLNKLDIYRDDTVKRAISPVATGESLCFSKGVTMVCGNHAVGYQNLFEKLLHQFTASPQIPLEIYLTVHEIFALLNKTQKSDFQTIQKGIDYLENTQTFDLKMQDIGKLCNVSVRYFEKLFKAYAGVSPKEYMDARRISLIKILLSENLLSLEEIAQRLSFFDSGHLCRFFKQKTGLTPTAYKKMNR